jgi:hypothetical protein
MFTALRTAVSPVVPAVPTRTLAVRESVVPDFVTLAHTRTVSLVCQAFTGKRVCNSIVSELAILATVAPKDASVTLPPRGLQRVPFDTQREPNPEGPMSLTRASLDGEETAGNLANVLPGKMSVLCETINVIGFFLIFVWHAQTMPAFEYLIGWLHSLELFIVVE